MSEHVIITIYGSYDPEAVRTKLIPLRDYLRVNGFPNTNLVSDFPVNFFPEEIHRINDEEENIIARSYFCVDESDFNVFIFTFDFGSGVHYELRHSFDGNLQNFLVITEINTQGEKAHGIFLEPDIRNVGRNYAYFDEGDIDALCDLVYDRIYDRFCY